VRELVGTTLKTVLGGYCLKGPAPFFKDSHLEASVYLFPGFDRCDRRLNYRKEPEDLAQEHRRSFPHHSDALNLVVGSLLES